MFGLGRRNNTVYEQVELLEEQIKEQQELINKLEQENDYLRHDNDFLQYSIKLLLNEEKENEKDADCKNI